MIEKATMSYGYGMSVSLLQMARAYSVFARDGDMVSLSLIKRDQPPTTTQVYPPEVARRVRAWLEAAAGPEGAKAAQVVRSLKHLLAELRLLSLQLVALIARTAVLGILQMVAQVTSQ